MTEIARFAAMLAGQGFRRDGREEEVLAHRETRPDDANAEFPRTSKRKEPCTTRMRTLGKAPGTISGP
ncbi:MAG: hypothetical protein H5U13_13435 [Parvibaculum sp.]|nr:hypothetical protein [Parvibaculum sp.]